MKTTKVVLNSVFVGIILVLVYWQSYMRTQASFIEQNIQTYTDVEAEHRALLESRIYLRDSIITQLNFLINDLED